MFMAHLITAPEDLVTKKSESTAPVSKVPREHGVHTVLQQAARVISGAGPCT